MKLFGRNTISNATKSNILKEIYENVEIEYSEKGLSEYDPYDELKSDMFDTEAKRYIEQKLPGWKTLIDYNHDKDNLYVG